MSRLPILLACIGLSACAPGDDRPFNATEEASRAADAAAQSVEEGVTAAEAPATNAWTKGAMVAAADPRAVEAGLEMLRQGGSAIDAAIAVHSVLGLVEPQSSGIGGGAFMVYYDRAKDEITVFDGREVAPASTTPDHFMKDGKPLGFLEAWQSGKAVGVPGQIALYKTSHEAAGKLEWDALFQPAIKLAEDGFEVSPRLAGLLANPRLRGAVRLDDLPASSEYFYPGGEPLPVGFIRTNPDYAATLSAIADSGPAAFYEGDIAQAIVDAVNGDAVPGDMSLEDLSTYSVKVRPALCGDRTDHYRICSAPPPSSGGVTQNMIMGLYDLLEPTDETSMTEEGYLKAFVDAQRLAYADRDHYLADADFVPVPSKDLINPAYLRVRAKEAFAPDAASFPGDPGVALGRDPIRPLWGEDATEHAPGTTHISIVDADGNAVSMTSSIERAFGSRLMTRGFMLNNQLTDFAFRPNTRGGALIANSAMPGKRPRSSMAPTLVFDGRGQVVMAIGSPGGTSIIGYVTKALIAALDWKLNIQSAVDSANFLSRNDGLRIEAGTRLEKMVPALEKIGHQVKLFNRASGLNGIFVNEGGLEGGTDKRREGVALGD